MPNYIKSSGEVIDTSSMAQPYLERALAKAQNENNTENIDALTQEMNLRGEESIDTTSEEDTINQDNEESLYLSDNDY